MQNRHYRATIGAILMMLNYTLIASDTKDAKHVTAQMTAVLPAVEDALTQPLDDRAPSNLTDKPAERNPYIVWYKDTLTPQQRMQVDEWQTKNKISLVDSYILWHRMKTGAYGASKVGNSEAHQ